MAVVSKSSTVVVVGADDQQSSGAGTIDLSSFDKSLGPLPITVLLVFDHPIKDPVESIKKALSQSLAVDHYHPMAGRLTPDGGAIACTGEGVSFVGASVSCALADQHLPLLKDDLAMGYPGDWCRPEDPLVQMQVTEFSCGGFVVGVTWNHVMADGAGMAQFLRAIGELARGLPSPSVVPVRSSSLLPCIPPSVVAAQRAMMAVASKDMASLDFTIPSSAIARIKGQWADANAHEQPCTVFEAVTALLWLCRTRAVVTAKDDDELPVGMVFPSNVRQQLGAEAGYYGNCLAAQLVQATTGAPAINGLVKLIKRAKDGGDQQQPLHQGAAVGWYDTLLVSSWRNLGFEAAEFGGGAPARVMWHQRQTVLPICVVCPPCKGKDDGVNVMSMCVRPEHADSFQAALHAAYST
ncbi:acyl transferase 15 [Brachypodium distachyon]|nr:acyl transferase 15 [Brachypodium distachyon]|eukprot:XP_003580970.1 acyl transferase 15 [Brachypodium distachyon]